MIITRARECQEEKRMGEYFSVEAFRRRVRQLKDRLDGSSRKTGEFLGVSYQTVDRWLRDDAPLDIGRIDLRTYLTVMGHEAFPPLTVHESATYDPPPLPPEMQEVLDTVRQILVSGEATVIHSLRAHLEALQAIHAAMTTSGRRAQKRGKSKEPLPTP
jgi:hypothetical protein